MFGAQSLDIEGVARNEMLEALDRLRRTDQATGTTARHLAFLADRQAPAFGTQVGKDVLAGPRRAFVEHHRNHLRDDVAGALDDDGIADAHLLAANLVLVVQRRPCNDDAADGDRLQVRHRG